MDPFTDFAALEAHADFTVERDAMTTPGLPHRYTTRVLFKDGQIVTEAVRPENPEKADEQALLNVNDQLGGERPSWVPKPNEED